jgi:asparagine synthase (glutamine-hydrolysing)
MCGIAGIYNPERKNNYSVYVNKMIDCMHHRGPDGKGFYNQDGISLGHTRLAIIDLSSNANQPFISQDHQYAFVFNGEIFNFRDLKKELKHIHFQTESDTEVLFHGLMEFGEDYVQKLRGFYAFALYDFKQHRLLLGRDPLGIKPLYYYLGKDGSTHFASEMKALKELHNQEIRTDGLWQYLTYQSTLPNTNIFKEIREVEPGQTMDIYGKEMNMTIRWSPSTFVSKLAQPENTKDKLVKAVERRLVSDVPVATFLSGGLDSSILTAIQSKYLNHKPITYSVIFNESEYNEESYSDLLAKKYRTDHHKIKIPEEDILQNILEAWNSLDNPSGDGVNSYIICKAIKSYDIKVALSGVGADELFGGYTYYDRIPKLMSQHLWITYLGKILPSLSYDVLPAKIKRVIERIKCFEPGNVGTYYHGLKYIFSPKELEELGLNYIDLSSWVRPADGHMTSLITSLDLERYTIPVLVKDMDQMSMAHSIELREPFLDRDLVEHVLALPTKAKQKKTHRKQLLIDLFKEDIPEEIYTRKKMGFTFPWNVWLRTHLKDTAVEALDHLKTRDILNPKKIDQLAKLFFDKNGNNYYQILLLVQLEFFLRNHLGE